MASNTIARYRNLSTGETASPHLIGETEDGRRLFADVEGWEPINADGLAVDHECDEIGRWIEIGDVQEVTYAQFADEIHARESRLAYGSETAILGHFVAEMRKLGGEDFRESDSIVPADDLAWWRQAYDLYEADMALPADDQAADVQEIFDRVAV